MVRNTPNSAAVFLMSILFIGVCFVAYYFLDWSLQIITVGVVGILWVMVLWYWARDMEAGLAFRSHRPSDETRVAEALQRMSTHQAMVFSMFLGSSIEEAQQHKQVADEYDHEMSLAQPLLQDKQKLTYEFVLDMIAYAAKFGQLPAQDGHPQRYELAALAKWMIDNKLAVGGPSTSTKLIATKREVLEAYRTAVMRQRQEPENAFVKSFAVSES